MQVEYRFRPANHWNVVSAAVYKALLPFYVNDRPQRLMITTVKEKE